MLRTAKAPAPSRTDNQIRRLTLINSVIGIAIAGISTRVFMISVPTLAVALETDILGISWALIVYQMAGIGLVLSAAVSAISTAITRCTVSAWP